MFRRVTLTVAAAAFSLVVGAAAPPLVMAFHDSWPEGTTVHTRTEDAETQLLDTAEFAAATNSAGAGKPLPAPPIARKRHQLFRAISAPLPRTSTVKSRCCAPRRMRTILHAVLKLQHATRCLPTTAQAHPQATTPPTRALSVMQITT